MNFCLLSNKRKVHDKVRKIKIPNTQNLIFFNSEFESGNLHRAIRVSDYEYNLYLEYDKNSRNYTQWYYFSWRNVRKGKIHFCFTKFSTLGVTVIFNIINLLKVDSSYNEGMKPCVYSKRNEETLGTKWHRAGFDIWYRK